MAIYRVLRYVGHKIITLGTMGIATVCSYVWDKELIPKSSVTALWREQFETVVTPNTTFRSSLDDI
jgi:hypothetical protein